MRLIKDLGTRRVTSGKMVRYGLYECPKCNINFETKTTSVTTGRSEQCISCSRKSVGDRTKTHGKSSSRLYRIWTGMKERCSYKKHSHYDNYGGKGINVCVEWKSSFELFEQWSRGNGYTEGVTIDRIDNSKDYEPSNCRWVDRFVQARNVKPICKSNTSGYKGVSFHKGQNKWNARIGIDNKRVHLGTFDYPWTAAYTYDSYVLKNNLEHTRNFK